MSVPTWKRSNSKVEFLNLLMELNINIGKITANKPKKYKANYGVDEPSASRTYQSWRGYAKQCSAYNSARNMEQLFYNLGR